MYTETSKEGRRKERKDLKINKGVRGKKPVESLRRNKNQRLLNKIETQSLTRVEDGQCSCAVLNVGNNLLLSLSILFFSGFSSLSTFPIYFYFLCFLIAFSLICHFNLRYSVIFLVLLHFYSVNTCNNIPCLPLLLV